MPRDSLHVSELPPGPQGSLFLGNTFAYLRDQFGFLTAAVKQYGDILTVRGVGRSRIRHGEAVLLLATIARRYQL